MVSGVRALAEGLAIALRKLFHSGIVQKFEDDEWDLVHSRGLPTEEGATFELDSSHTGGPSTVYVQFDDPERDRRCRQMVPAASQRRRLAAIRASMVSVLGCFHVSRGRIYSHMAAVEVDFLPGNSAKRGSHIVREVPSSVP